MKCVSIFDPEAIHAGLPVPVTWQVLPDHRSNHGKLDIFARAAITTSKNGTHFCHMERGRDNSMLLWLFKVFRLKFGARYKEFISESSHRPKQQNWELAAGSEMTKFEERSMGKSYAVTTSNVLRWRNGFPKLGHQNRESIELNSLQWMRPSCTILLKSLVLMNFMFCEPASTDFLWDGKLFLMSHCQVKAWAKGKSFRRSRKRRFSPSYQIKIPCRYIEINC